MSTGWTFEEVGNLTLLDLQDLQRYWAEHPPLHLMVQKFLGIKGSGVEAKEVKKEPTAEELLGILAEFPELTHGR